MDNKNKNNARTVIITGAGSGIGKACCKLFLSKEDRVIGCDIKTDGIPEGVVHEKADVSNEVEVKALFDRYPDIDVLVNCAGLISLIKWDAQDTAEWERVMSVNMRGTFLCCKYAALHMRTRKSGCIVNITAAAAKTGGMNVGPNYVASKAGITTLTIHMARQLAPHGIRVNAISPGPIDTPMLTGDSGGGEYSPDMKANIAAASPLGMGYPEDIANGVVFLADNVLARYITGEILDIDGGLFMD